VWVDSQQVWNRKEKGEFPEMKELKQLVRAIVEPGKDLGHSEGKKKHHGGKEQEQEQEQGEKLGEKKEEGKPTVATVGDVCVDCQPEGK